MKNVIIAIALVFSSLSMAQNDEAYVESLVSEFTSKLESRNITSWFVNNRYCSGTIEMFQLDNGRMCTSKGTYVEAYLFWKDEGKPMIKKFDNCGMYYSLELSNAEAIEFLYANVSDLESGIVKKYNSESLDGTPKLRTEVHNCFRDFKFAVENDSFGQTYNLFDLTNDSESPNTNFEYNNNLKVVKLDKLLDSFITEMEPKFRRQN